MRSSSAAGLTRRRLLQGGLAAGLAGTTMAALSDAPASATPTTVTPRLRDGSADPTGIHPFRVAVPTEQLAALRRRVAATRWPSMELVGDRSQGVQLATTEALAKFWTSRWTETGWDTSRTARAWAELMRRLGYTRYVAQGGDVGAGVTDNLGRQAPAGLIGIHLNLLVTALSGVGLPTNTAEECAAAAALAEFTTTGNGYLIEQSTRPQTIGAALLDSPVALAAWMLDHDTDSYYKISRAFLGGPISGNLTRDHVLDNITLYWLTGTGASAARSYWENARARAAGAGQVPPPVTVPVAFSAFSGEIFQAPRSWVQNSYPTLSYYNQPARGGHFAAWEEPELFAREIRAAFRSVR